MSTRQLKPIAKGAWSEAEDERLREAVAKHGSRWILIAADVGSRNGEQCAKRWNDHINPDLNHSPWSAQEDQRLLPIVEHCGHNWKHISENFLQSRSPLSIKNRYSLLMRRRKRQNTKHHLGDKVGSRIPAWNTPPSESHSPCNMDIVAVQPQNSIDPFDSALPPIAPNTIEPNQAVDISELFAINNPLANVGLASRASQQSGNDSTSDGWGDKQSICNNLDLDLSEFFNISAGGESLDTQMNGPQGGGGDKGLEFSVTCSRSKLKAMVCHIFEGAMLQTAEQSEEEPVTVTLRLKK